MHHIWYYIWGNSNAWIFCMEKIIIFYKIIENGFYEFMALFENSKDFLSWFVIFGKLIENLNDKKWFWKIWELCEMLGYWKVLRKYLETNYDFHFHLNESSVLFLPLNRNRCDYPARCRSLCDISILATCLCGELISLWHIWCLRGIIDVFMVYLMSSWHNWCLVALG